MDMTPSEPLSPTIILLIVIFCIIIAISFIVLAVALTRSKTPSNFAQDLLIYEEQLAAKRNDFTFLFSPRLGGYRLSGNGSSSSSNANAKSDAVGFEGKAKRTWGSAFGGYGWYGGGGLPATDSMTSIRVSPSQPTVFGSEKEIKGVPRMQVTVTPPTPAKKERVFRAVLNDRAPGI